MRKSLVGIVGMLMVVAFLPTMLANVAFAEDKKPTVNYFRMSEDQIAEYNKLYSAGSAKSKDCHLEYLDCWQVCVPGCAIGAHGQLMNCSSCYTTEQRCGKPTLVCKGETAPSGEYWTGEMESRRK